MGFFDNLLRKKKQSPEPKESPPKSAAPSPPEPLSREYKVGDRIGGRFEIHRILAGGMGTVYVCYDYEFQEAAVLKTIQNKFLQSKERRDSFKREILAWVTLERHPYIVRARWAQEYDYRLFIVADYIAPDEQGRNTLSHHLQGGLSLKQQLTWAIECCRGMEYAVGKGVTPHRDIKPDNLMISSNGTLMITDFGLAGIGHTMTEVPEHKEQKGLTFIRLNDGKITGGTLPYMAPEQFQGIANEQSDLYALGIVLYQMAAQGRLPFEAATPQSWETCHQSLPIPPLATPLFPIIEYCTRKNSRDRYRSFSHLLHDLEELYRKTQKQTPPSPPEQSELQAWELSNKGASLANLGLLDDAIASYREAMRLNPGDADAHYNLGHALGKKGLVDEAIASCREAIRLNPGDADAHNNLGNALAKKGLLDEAIASFRETIRLNPEYALAHSNLGTALADKGLLDDAITSHREAIRLDPGDVDAHSNLGTALAKKGLLDDAIASYREALRLDPGNAVAHSNLGTTFAKKGLLDETIVCYREAIRLDPGNAVAHYNLGNILTQKGHNNEAAAAYESFIRYASPEYAGYVEQTRKIIRELKGEGQREDP
jgi:serine/threonine protein kinase